MSVGWSNADFLKLGQSAIGQFSFGANNGLRQSDVIKICFDIGRVYCPSPTPSPTIDQQALLLEYLKQQKAQEREAARIAAEQEAQRLKDEIAAKQSQLAQMKVECDDPINQLKLQQTKIKSDYYSKVAEIQNKPISMSSINSQIIQLTNDANIQLGQIDAQLQQLALQCSTKYGN